MSPKLSVTAGHLS